MWTQPRDFVDGIEQFFVGEMWIWKIGSIISINQKINKTKKKSENRATVDFVSQMFRPIAWRIRMGRFKNRAMQCVKPVHKSWVFISGGFFFCSQFNSNSIPTNNKVEQKLSLRKSTSAVQSEVNLHRECSQHWTKTENSSTLHEYGVASVFCFSGEGRSKGDGGLFKQNCLKASKFLKN